MTDYEYLVIPFIGKIKSGFFSVENAQTVSNQLQEVINKYSTMGWEYNSIEKVSIEVRPGCLAGLFGSETSYITFDQIIFRKEKLNIISEAEKKALDDAVAILKSKENN